MSLRLLVVLIGLLSYLATTVAGGAVVLCSGPEGVRAIELAVGGNRCAESCAEREGGESNEPAAPECADEALDVGDVRVADSTPISFPPLAILCGILPEPVLRPLHFDERENHPPQPLACVATVVLVI